MIGHYTHLGENEDLPLWRGPAVKKKPPFFNAHALIMHEIMQYWGMTLSQVLTCNASLSISTRSLQCMR